MKKSLILFIALCTNPFGVGAQVSFGGRPVTLELGKNLPEPQELPALDKQKALQEDAQHPEFARFAAPVFADISPEYAGEWEDGNLWRCRLRAEGAQGLVLLFDRFELREGARLFAYTPNGKTVLGAYTRNSCVPSGKFTIGVIPGEEVVLELTEPDGERSDIHLNRVDFVYDKSGLNGPEIDFGDGLPCNININCSQGADWQTEKKGVARILMVFSNGSGWCSGTLIANTAQTADPYFLTAHHCQLIGLQPDFDQWVFHFDYEAPGCNNPVVEPSFKSVLGCERIAFRTETDFMLLKLNPIPPTYGLYFNGWDRTTVANIPRSTFIHHPLGDIKKISVDTNDAIVYAQTLNWGGVFGISPPNTHWRVIPDFGTFQPGSSGSPLFNPAKRIVGQLHGGSWQVGNQCIVTGAYFGIFGLSWNTGVTPDTRLRDWLDPGSTNATTQNGYPQPLPTTVTLSGNVQTHWGSAMHNVKVELSGDATAVDYTDVSGNFSFPNLPSGGTYIVKPIRDTNTINGMTTFDLVLISKHILDIEPLNSPWKIIAGDANKSNSLTTFDIVENRKIILGINNNFPINTAWRFFPADHVFTDPANPFADNMLTESIILENLETDFSQANFRGVKIGDTNNSADPGQ